MPGPPRPWTQVPPPPLPLVLLVLAACGGRTAPAPRAEDLSLEVEWLSKFGYLPPADPATGQLQTQEELSKAVAAMQRFAGLEATGVLDVATRARMRTPRCSLPDLPAPARRRRQAPAPTKWSKRNLSWRVRTFPRDSPLGRDTVRALMHYALKVWGDITPLNFHEVAGSAADIQIDFSTADHNDRYPFDGPGGTVAHAFLPGDHHTAGDAHFDDDEAWTFRSSDAHGMDLFAVAVHEFGHAIGLSHVAATQSIMQPYYQGPVGDPLHYGLPYADRVRAWQLYGVRESVSPTAQLDTAEPEETPLLPEPPDHRPSTPHVPGKDVPHRCSAHFDAVAQIRGEAFFFKGRYFWRLNRDRHLVSLQPAQMHRFWRGLPPHLDGVDAVYERTIDHKIVFFRGDRYWVFQDTHVEEGFPRPVSDFGLPPGGVDAAFSWAHSDKTYFFKDQLYWRYNELTRRMDPGHPARSPPWRGVPSTLDDAMRWSDGAAYFFRGREYWKVPDSELAVAPGYPQSTARDWLVCRDPQADPEGGGAEGEAGAHAPPGQHDRSHAEDGYQVCACSSLAARPPGPAGSLLATALLPPLGLLRRGARALAL
ncbi:matrix metalloproteinase-17 [Myotis myotis]|uniref:Matrix metalloproteinase-17 n=1 Tax=Myotis myotis TaxID=51298 RepID=A0A7J7R4X7_MYOMY|nr:matrix metalloproteinase-17 [Myotis myotis]KAF6271122.1 matrix metallopeptidase 17 [Myotis myotis]